MPKLIPKIVEMTTSIKKKVNCSIGRPTFMRTLKTIMLSCVKNYFK